jgi:hypothetical protein
MAWRCGSLTARFGQHGHVVPENYCILILTVDNTSGGGGGGGGVP